MSLQSFLKQTNWHRGKDEDKRIRIDKTQTQRVQNDTNTVFNVFKTTQTHPQLDQRTNVRFTNCYLHQWSSERFWQVSNYEPWTGPSPPPDSGNSPRPALAPTASPTLCAPSVSRRQPQPPITWLLWIWGRWNITKRINLRFWRKRTFTSTEIVFFAANWAWVCEVLSYFHCRQTAVCS